MRESNEIRILIVEDMEEKLEQIRSALTVRFEQSRHIALDITTATCYSEAQRKIDNLYFDAVVLDLKIPMHLGDKNPRIENSKFLYDYIYESSPNKPFYVLGLTSAKEEEVAAVFSESANFSIARFSADGAWLDTLSRQIEFVVGAKSGLANYLSNNYGLDVLLVTARKSNEYDPILKVIEWEGGFCRPRAELNGMNNRFGVVKLGDGVRINLGIVCLDEMGLSHAAAVTVSMINLFRPRFMAMLGMCCGLKKQPKPNGKRDRAKTKLGDILVASETCCWDEGKYEEGDEKLINSPFFNNRAVNRYPERDYWRSVERFLDQEEVNIESLVKEYYETQSHEKIKAGLRGGIEFSSSATLHRWPMVSGACVIDSEQMIAEIETRFPRAYGLEMEAHAVYSAVDCCNGIKPKTLVIKGVADFGDGTKASSVQAIASVASYLTYKHILRLHIEDHAGAR